MFPRIGFGHDLHRLEPGEGLWLGGIRVPCAFGAVAHSDGDVLLHAVTDALLGAVGGPDIGDLFPDSADENRDRASRVFVEAALESVRQRGYRVGNLDTVLVLEKPKLGVHKEAMAASVAELCGCTKDDVCIKAKTAEQTGPVGRGEAIEAWVTVLVVPERGAV